MTRVGRVYSRAAVAIFAALRGSGQSVILFVGCVRGLRRWCIRAFRVTKSGVWQIDAATSKYEIDIGLPRIGQAVAMLYHHTVVPNWAVRIAGDQGPRQVHTA